MYRTCIRLAGWRDIESVLDTEKEIWRLVNELRQQHTTIDSLVTAMTDNMQDGGMYKVVQCIRISNIVAVKSANMHIRDGSRIFPRWGGGGSGGITCHRDAYMYVILGGGVTEGAWQI